MLQNKLHAPTINKNIISRKTLLSKFRHAEDSRLTLVTAPAGYGKTTAVFDWLCHCEMPSVWLSLNEYNSSPSTFWRGICFALEDVIPSIVKGTEYILATPELLHANLQINVLSDAIAAFGQEFAFVLDDVHLISDGQILKGLSYFIEYMPTNMHLVIISRTKPELELAKYRLKWQMQTIDGDDLLFQREDIYRFYRARGFRLNQNEIEKLEVYSEGWIASLVAVAMAMEGENESYIISELIPSINRDIGQYLRDEIMGNWAEEKRIFALKTSVLETLSEGVCDAVTGETNARVMLAEIYRENAFLNTPDEGSGEYTFHHLFRSLLSKLLTEDYAEQIPQLHARAGFWYQNHDVIDKAMEHFLSAGLYKEALSIIEDGDIYHMYDHNILISWLDRLPKQMREGSFKAAYIYAKYYPVVGNYDLARFWIKIMRELAASPENTATPELAAFCAIACALAETNVLLIQGSLDFIGPLESALALFDKQYYKMPDYIDFNTTDVYFYRCPIRFLSVFFSRQKERYEAFGKSYRALINVNPGYKPLAAGAFLYESNLPEEALPYLLAAMEEARSARCPGALVPVIADLVRIKRITADYEGAFKALDECDNLLCKWSMAHWSYPLRALRCRLYIDLCDNDKIENWIGSCMLDIYSEINKINEYGLIVYSRALNFKNRHQDAKILLQRLLAFTEKTDRTHSMVEVLCLMAMLAYSRGNRTKAVACLDKALSAGRERQYVRSFLDEGAPMTTLLNLYVRQPLTKESLNFEYANFLLSEIKSRKGENTVQDKYPAGLTLREREVLELLLEAYSNRQISERLGITLQTVKIHIGNIYSKLNVKSRAECLKLVNSLQPNSLQL